MDIDLEGLVVGLFALLPGFVSASIRRCFCTYGDVGAASWIAGSVVRSLFFNALILLVILALRLLAVDLDVSLEAFQAGLPSLSVGSLALYLLSLYALAVVWGVLTGLWPHLAPQSMLFLAYLSPVSPESNVFTQALAERYRTRTNLAKRGTGHMKVPWLVVKGEAETVCGRLQHSTDRIDATAPFEVFLSPAFRLEKEGAKELSSVHGMEMEGVYARINPEQIVKVFSATERWLPTSTHMRITDVARETEEGTP